MSPVRFHLEPNTSREAEPRFLFLLAVEMVRNAGSVYTSEIYIECTLNPLTLSSPPSPTLLWWLLLPYSILPLRLYPLRVDEVEHGGGVGRVSAPLLCSLAPLHELFRCVSECVPIAGVDEMKEMKHTRLISDAECGERDEVVALHQLTQRASETEIAPVEWGDSRCSSEAGDAMDPSSSTDQSS